MERRFSGTEVRNDGTKIVGTASVTYNGDKASEYELWEGVVERIAPGAFDNHLNTNPDVVALFNHDPSQVLGRTPDTLKLRADKSGLHYEIPIDDTEDVMKVAKLIQKGKVKGSSFAFEATTVEWEQDGNRDVRMVREAKLHDVSPVTRPAYGATSSYVRSEERAALEKERQDYRAKIETEKRMLTYEKKYAAN